MKKKDKIPYHRVDEEFLRIWETEDLKLKRDWLKMSMLGLLFKMELCNTASRCMKPFLVALTLFHGT